MSKKDKIKKKSAKVTPKMEAIQRLKDQQILAKEDGNNKLVNLINICIKRIENSKE